MKKLSEKLNNYGGSAWESNPPKTLLMPPDGFEVREAHRDSSAPYTNQVYITNENSAIVGIRGWAACLLDYSFSSFSSAFGLSCAR